MFKPTGRGPYYELSYAHLYSSTSTGLLRTHSGQLPVALKAQMLGLSTGFAKCVDSNPSLGLHFFSGFDFTTV